MPLLLSALKPVNRTPLTPAVYSPPVSPTVTSVVARCNLQMADISVLGPMSLKSTVSTRDLYRGRLEVIFWPAMHSD